MVTVFSSSQLFLLIHGGYLFDYFLSGFRIVDQNDLLRTKDFCEVKMSKKYQMTFTQDCSSKMPINFRLIGQFFWKAEKIAYTRIILDINRPLAGRKPQTFYQDVIKNYQNCKVN